MIWEARRPQGKDVAVGNAKGVGKITPRAGKLLKKYFETGSNKQSRFMGIRREFHSLGF
jgi:hypothetical protein